MRAASSATGSIRRRPSSPPDCARATPSSAPGAAGRLRERDIELEHGRWDAFYAGVRDWARGGAPPPVDATDGLIVLEILEAAARSSKRSEVVAAGPDGRFTIAAG